MPRKLLRFPLLSVFGFGKLSLLLVRRCIASNGCLSPSVGNVSPAPCSYCGTEQPPRRVLASRLLLFSEVRVPRLDPAPRRKRGAGFKTREGMRLPLVAVCAGRYRAAWRSHFLLGLVLAALSITGASEAAAPFVGR